MQDFAYKTFSFEIFELDKEKTVEVIWPQRVSSQLRGELPWQPRLLFLVPATGQNKMAALDLLQSTLGLTK